jgi:hypothetical protein
VPKRDIESVEYWHHNSPHAIMAYETAYLTETHDLIQVVPKNLSLMGRILGKSTHFQRFKFWASKDPPLPRYNASTEHLHYSSEERINQTIAFTITAVGMLMLIVPL